MRLCLLGRDKKTKWMNTKPVQDIRTHIYMMVSHLPDIKGAASQARSPVERVGETSSTMG
jgi:hypothetical protein